MECDYERGRVLAERLFGTIPRPAMPHQDESLCLAYLDLEWWLIRKDNPTGKVWPVAYGEDIACMAIMRALKRATRIDKGNGWIQWRYRESGVYADGSNDLLALSLLACKVFGVDDKVSPAKEAVTL